MHMCVQGFPESRAFSYLLMALYSSHGASVCLLLTVQAHGGLQSAVLCLSLVYPHLQRELCSQAHIRSGAQGPVQDTGQDAVLSARSSSPVVPPIPARTGAPVRCCVLFKDCQWNLVSQSSGACEHVCASVTRDLLPLLRRPLVPFLGPPLHLFPMIPILSSLSDVGVRS